MPIGRVLPLLDKYTICPECSNGYLGNGQGTLIIGENSFERSCKCGFKVFIQDKESR